MFIHGFASPPPPMMSGDGPAGFPLCFDAPLQRFGGDARTQGVTPNLRLRFLPKASAFVVLGRKRLLLTESVQR